MLTPNYYVQAMFAATVGDYVVQSEMVSLNKLIYDVVTRTEDKLYVKLVNVSAYADDMTLNLANVPDGVATYTRLTGEKNDVNTMQKKDRVVPVTGEVNIADGTLQLTLPAYSVTILTFNLK